MYTHNISDYYFAIWAALFLLMVIVGQLIHRRVQQLITTTLEHIHKHINTSNDELDKSINKLSVVQDKIKHLNAHIARLNYHNKEHTSIVYEQFYESNEKYLSIMQDNLIKYSNYIYKKNLMPLFEELITHTCENTLETLKADLTPDLKSELITQSLSKLSLLAQERSSSPSSQSKADLL